MKTLQKLAGLLTARQNCIEFENIKWQGEHEHNIEKIIDNLPSGSGIDNGNHINYEKSRTNRIVIDSSFHAMNDMGYYADWIDYQVVITSDLQFLFDLKIIGNFSRRKGNFSQNKNILKDYLEEFYSNYFADN